MSPDAILYQEPNRPSPRPIPWVKFGESNSPASRRRRHPRRLDTLLVGNACMLALITAMGLQIRPFTYLWVSLYTGFAVAVLAVSLTVRLERRHQQQLQEREAERERYQADLEDEVARRTSELRVAKAKAEEVARLKSEFLANMSHELRTPLNGVIGITDLVLGGELRVEQRELLAIVRSSADSLLTIINSVLDFSKLEARKVFLETVEFNLANLIAETMKAMALQAQQKGLELSYYLAPGTPDMIYGDPNALRQILVNLIGNATKFTEKGEVALRIIPESEDAREIALRFEVADTGIGIPLEKQTSIFAPFVQADGSSTRRYGGTGLGLAISSNLVELMGGRIQVRSKVGQGSTFEFTARLTHVTRHPLDRVQNGTKTSASASLLAVQGNTAATPAAMS
jgi:signal transduction histidine kinase